MTIPLFLFNAAVFVTFVAVYVTRKMTSLLLTLLLYGLLSTAALLAIRHNKLLLPAFLSLPRDLTGCWRYFWVKVYTLLTLWTNQTVFSMFDRTVRRKRHSVCWYFEDEVWTFHKVEEMSHRVAEYFQRAGFKKGDTVGLLMQNRPEYVVMWLGLSRLGVVTALLNWNLRNDSLRHCIRIANCKALIFGEELSQVVGELGGLDSIALYSVKDRGERATELPLGTVDLSEGLEGVERGVKVEGVAVGALDAVLYVFTSGTTGLPKAAVLKHSRAVMFTSMYMMQGMRGSDVLMTPIPLYHLLGGVSGVGLTFCFGIPQVIVRKFSASRFWKDCVKYDVTVCQYLGEIIRYLLRAEEVEEEKVHRVRFLFGNGVNAGVWKEFTERFGTRIQEMYGSTEGNANIINFRGDIGAAGFVPLWIWPFVPAGVVKVDLQSGELLRDPATGLGIECDFGEPGEFVGVIRKGDSLRQFDGYTDLESTEKKIARSVFRRGDSVFRTGDILVRDVLGNLYFKDRFGDTFRWKGENVSTTEVEGVVARGSGMKGVVVYGVEVRGTEGRAGMAAIADPEGTLDLEALTWEINKQLPKYARPLFLRLIDEIEMTGTFKLKKLGLGEEGFDPARIKDPMFFYDGDRYVPFDVELHEKVTSGVIRV